MKDFADHCLRGIRSEKFITNAGRVSSLAFKPDDNSLKNRDDNFKETSINWEDDEKAFPKTMHDYQFGVARLARQKIDEFRKLPQFSTQNHINYERNPIEDNDYHGNILINGDLGNEDVRLITGRMATDCTYHPKVVE